MKALGVLAVLLGLAGVCGLIGTVATMFEIGRWSSVLSWGGGISIGLLVLSIGLFELESRLTRRSR